MGKRKQDEQQQPRPLETAPAVLPEAGYLRVAQIIPGLIPISRTAWYDGVKAGRYPKGVKLGPQIVAWRVSDIRALIDNGCCNSLV